MSTIRRLLVANRGEIARRIFSTARSMGIGTVAVYADPDADALFVREADLAVPLAGTTSTETYLDIAKIVEAARRTGADAVHPGYGFLAENADLAEAVSDAGLVWVGPPADAIARMGSKIEAKRLARDAGVPVLDTIEVSGGVPSDLPPFPLVVKASAGGGGRGMRVVADASELPDAIAGARREAESSFGDPTVFVERWLPSPRHVEIQVIGDAHGTVVHLFERECSIQRRHQKVIEETPSPGIDVDTRERMAEAAVSLAREIGYRNAGTVEFVGSGDEFFLLEMNTRLQVEHPVTEAVCGLDLVRLQLEVAAGERLDVDPVPRGHAIEARLYAEDPASGFLPSFGPLHAFEPGDVADVRHDTGFATGSAVSTHFDPMLAKVIVHRPTRAEAAAALARELRTMRIHGVVTNRDFLVAVLGHEAFLAGETTTDFIDRHPEVLRAGPGVEVLRRHVIAAALAGQARRRGDARVLGFVPSGWRNVPDQPQRATFRHAEETLEVDYTLHPSVRVSVDGDEVDVRLPGASGDEVDVELDGVRRRYAVHVVDGTAYVDGPDGSSALTEVPRFRLHAEEAAAGGPISPVPGTVASVECADGDSVKAGQTLVVLEAMKMEHRIEAPFDAVVAEILVDVGQNVDAHQLLVRLDEVVRDG